MDTHDYDSASVTSIPLLPLRDVVVYPHMVIPLFVGRQKSIAALERAMTDDKQVLLVAQKHPSVDEPTFNDLYNVGTVAQILQLLKLPDGTVKVLVEGRCRAQIESVDESERCFKAHCTTIPADKVYTREEETMARGLLKRFEHYVNFSKKVPVEVLNSLNGIDEPGRLVDTIAAHMTLDLGQKQRVLELFKVGERLEHLIGLMDSEADLYQVEKKIRGRVKKQMEKSQREYYLNEQLKAIQKELGELGEEAGEGDEFERRIAEAKMPQAAEEKTRAEINKLKMMSPMSAEASVIRSYVDWMLNVPWNKRSKINMDFAHAEKVLEEDHYGLTEVKERILEYLAVQKRVKKIKGPVICLVGPPGVGKTSLGESIARATNRKFVRMALGGVRDEAEIRGHRRTYIGSLPGKLLQKIAKTGVKNPLFLFDEIDKMGMDHRGDPASALLEVLDPEQNNKFNDHYLEVDYDLSDVMFVCTSNTMNIPGPLLDRMEVIRIPGYTEDEKLNIAMRYLLPKQRKNSGLADDELKVEESALRDIIRFYTREAGVRSLDREIAKLCRKVVTENVKSKKNAPRVLTSDHLEHYLGVKKTDYGRADTEDRIGQVTGLAWTQVGGELLTIEIASVRGKGRLVKTGSLGDVMQESIQAAFTVVRSRAKVLGIAPDATEKHDIHIHVPEGATPKDGPSAGIAMCTALVSALTRIPVRADVAMTGEITLRGQVLKIGGLKEKLLAAHRGGIRTVLIPGDNEADLREIPDNIKADLVIKPVRHIEEVLAVALTHAPASFSDDEFAALESKAFDLPKESPGISTH